MARQRSESPQWPEVDLAPWADSKLHVNFQFFDQLSPFNIDWPAVVNGIRCPVLLITGDPNLGALVMPEHALALQAWLPQLRTVHISGAGHSIRRDQSAAYLRVVRSFLAEVTILK